jgi:hypothetical protein
MHRPSLTFNWSIFRSSRRFKIIKSRQNWYVLNSNMSQKPIFRTHCPSVIYDRSTSFLTQYQNVYFRANWSINRRDTGLKPKFRINRPSLVMSRQSSPSWRSRDLITSSGISFTTIAIWTLCITTPMWIMDQVYFGCELEVGAPLSCDQFTVAQTGLDYHHTLVFRGL